MFGSKALPTERLRELFHGDQLAHHRARGRVGWRHGEESLSPHAVALSVGENATSMGLDGIPKARFDLVGLLLWVSSEEEVALIEPPGASHHRVHEGQVPERHTRSGQVRDGATFASLDEMIPLSCVR
jgi:hypothetical protein